MIRVPHELGRLLAGEIARHLPRVRAAETDAIQMRAALHALKGSAGMAGFTELALVIAQLAHRVQLGDPGARADVLVLLEGALARLEADLPPFESVWPAPPPLLAPASLEAKYRSEYLIAIHERLAELDAVPAADGDPIAGMERALRSVHAMKGAAAALGDDVTSWYCHGLESELRRVARQPGTARVALSELGRHRALLTLLIEDPKRGLLELRALAKPRPIETTETTRLEARISSSEREETAESPLKVPVHTLDTFSERLERIDLVYDELLRSGDLARRLSVRLRDTASVLSETRRQLSEPEGNPRGRAAALARIERASVHLRTSANNAERGAGIFRRNAEFLRARSTEMRRELAGLRRGSLQGLFERVKRATLRHADELNKLVSVEIIAREVAFDQRIAERLFDVVLQLAGNALVHGIEAPEARLATGKAAHGRITLDAEQIGDWLRVTISDDGRGADIARIREVAVQAGAASPEAARHAQEDELLALLFLPGITTHQRVDLLAGRGLGLDLVADTVRRMGGSIRLKRRLDGGFLASFEMPSDQRVVEVLWLEEQGQRFALPVSFVGKVAPPPDTPPAPVRLARCLGQPCLARAPVSLELAVYGVAPIRIGLDAVGEIEQVVLRSLPELLAERGPYAGAVLRSDGSLHLALDAPLWPRGPGSPVLRSRRERAPNHHPPDRGRPERRPGPARSSRLVRRSGSRARPRHRTAMADPRSPVRGDPGVFSSLERCRRTACLGHGDGAGGAAKRSWPSSLDRPSGFRTRRAQTLAAAGSAVLERAGHCALRGDGLFEGRRAPRLLFGYCGGRPRDAHHLGPEHGRHFARDAMTPRTHARYHGRALKRALLVSVTLGALLACEDRKREAGHGTGTTEPSPNATILPAPLASGIEGVNGSKPSGDEADHRDAGHASPDAGTVAPEAPPEPRSVREDQALPGETPHETSGLSLNARLRWVETAGPPRLPEQNLEGGQRARDASEFEIAIDLAGGRMRWAFASPAFTLPTGSELHARDDLYGYSLLWPNRAIYTVLQPGTLRSVLAEQRADVMPLVRARFGALSPGSLLGFKTDRTELVTPIGRLELEQAHAPTPGILESHLARVGRACAACYSSCSARYRTIRCAAPIWCLVAPNTPGPMANASDSRSLACSRQNELDPVALAMPPAGAEYRQSESPAPAPSALLSESELSDLRLRAAPRTERVDPSAPKAGLLVVNHSESLRYITVDGAKAARLLPGAEVLLLGLRPGKYQLAARDFFGGEESLQRLTEVPARFSLGEEPEKNH